MKSDLSFKFVVAAVLTGVLLAFAAPAKAKGAAEIDRTGSFSNSAGASGTFVTKKVRSKGSSTTQSTITNASGAVSTRQSQATWSQGSGTFSGTKTSSTGATSSWQGTSTKVSPGVIDSQGTITTAKGTTDTFTATKTEVSPGTWDKSEVITTASGKTIDRTVDTSVSNGVGTRETTTTLPNGNVVTGNANFTQTVTPLPASS